MDQLRGYIILQETLAKKDGTNPADKCMTNEANYAIFKELIERETLSEVAEIHGASEQKKDFPKFT